MMNNPYSHLKTREAVERSIISQHGEFVSLSSVTEQINVGQVSMLRASEAGNLEIKDGRISASAYADMIMRMKQRKVGE